MIKECECHYCHKRRHIQINCFLWKKEKKGKKGKQNERDHDDDGSVTTTTTSDDLVIFVSMSRLRLYQMRACG